MGARKAKRSRFHDEYGGGGDMELGKVDDKRNTISSDFSMENPMAPRAAGHKQQEQRKATPPTSRLPKPPPSPRHNPWTKEYDDDSGEYYW